MSLRCPSRRSPSFRSPFLTYGIGSAITQYPLSTSTPHMTFASAALLLFSFVGAPHVPGQHVQHVEGQACSASLDAPLRLRRLLGASKLVRPDQHNYSVGEPAIPRAPLYNPARLLSQPAPPGSHAARMPVCPVQEGSWLSTLSTLWSASLTFRRSHSTDATSSHHVLTIHPFERLICPGHTHAYGPSVFPPV